MIFNKTKKKNKIVMADRTDSLEGCNNCFRALYSVQFHRMLLSVAGEIAWNAQG